MHNHKPQIRSHGITLAKKFWLEKFGKRILTNQMRVAVLPTNDVVNLRSYLAVGIVMARGDIVELVMGLNISLILK
jgi:hypothetical protein